MEETLGKRIVFHRKRLGLTQDALAERMGVTAQAVSKWENDQSCPDIGALPKLAEIFGISTDELLGVERKEVHPTEIVPADTEENGVHIHPDGSLELSWDGGKKSSIGLAVWILLVGGIMLASYFLSFHAKLWDVLWPSALLVFGVLIAVHELGHFLAAKTCGVRVNEFAIGMGPTLWKKQKGETLYSLRAFPVGGFCAMEGEEESDDPAALSNQGFWQKLIIFAAGAAMNFLAGLVIIFCLYAPAQGFYQPVISGFAEGCPLESAGGLQTGDRIVAIDGERVYVYSDINLLFSLNKTGVFDLTVERDGQKVQLKDFAMERQTYTDQSGNEYSGYGIYFGAKAATFGDKLAYTWNNAVDFVRMVRLSLQMLLSGQAGLRDLSGPVGIVSTMVQVGEQAETTRAAVENIAYIAALIAVNLAVMNLLPLPALDGGRIFFLFVNAVAMLLFKKQIPAKYENYIHFAGLILLLALMVVLVFSDVGKLIK